MKGLRITVFVLVFLGLSTQLARHVYVRWLAKHDSILEKYEPVSADIRTATSLADLEKRYQELKEKQKARKAAKLVEQGEERESRPARGPRFDPEDEEYLETMQVEQAIRQWEEKENEIRELWYFCGFGVFCLLAALACSAKGWRWLSLTLQVGGFSELMFWTSPSFHLSGAEHEFNRLLDRKIVVTLVALGFLLVYWLRGPLRKPDEDPA